MYVGSRVARPTLLLTALCLIWITGIVLLLSYTRTNPIDAGRSLISQLGSRPAQVPVVVDEYDLTCSRLPHAAQELRRLDERWGKISLEMSVAHQGSGIRMRRALRRLVNGEPFVIGAIGGSITAGHGVNTTLGMRYTSHLEAILQKTYPNVTVLNAGIAGHGTDYFASCYYHHMRTDADLYILETAVNDLENADKLTKVGESQDTSHLTEILVRQLLSNRPDNAVMMLSSFGSDKWFKNAAHLHNVVSEYYDLPRLSMRNFMYPYMLQFPDERKSHFDSPDIRHPNELGHEYMADMILRYLLRAMCGASDEEDKGLVPHPMHEYEPEVDVWDGKAGYNPQSVKEADKPWLPYPGLAGSELKYSWDPFTLPSLRLDQNWIMDPRPHPEGTSFCQTVDLISPDGLPAMRPSANQGWEHFENRGKHYWKATQPGSIITFDNIEVNAGIVAIFHLRCDQNYGNAKCWVDNMKDRAVEIVSIWDFVCISALHVIAEGVSPGEHSVTCEVVEQTADKNDKHDFAIAAIISH